MKSLLKGFYHVALGTVFLIGSATVASAAVDGCAKTIQKLSQKLAAKVTGGLNKCMDGALKAQVKGDPFDDAASKCQSALDKTINASNAISAVAKTLGKLAQAGPSDKAKCSDTDLYGLGHLPEATFDDMWQKLVAVNAIRVGYEDSNGANALLTELFRGMDDTGQCALCHRSSIRSGSLPINHGFKWSSSAETTALVW